MSNELAGDLRIRRQSLHDVVVDRLRDLIVEGVLSPGQRLNERLLCEQLGVSRTPLRESFKVLASEGLIEILPNRGATVAPLTIEELKEVVDVLSGLEAVVGPLVAERIDAVACRSSNRCTGRCSSITGSRICPPIFGSIRRSISCWSRRPGIGRCSTPTPRSISASADIATWRISPMSVGLRPSQSTRRSCRPYVVATAKHWVTCSKPICGRRPSTC